MREATHQDPVWRHRSDFIIAAEISPHPLLTEQLWARQLGPHTFEVCCIPFFVYDVALGDVVTTTPGHGRQYLLNEVIHPSGRYVFRAWLEHAGARRSTIVDDIEQLGALLEWSSRDLLAIDAVDAHTATAIAGYLQSCEGAGQLMFETGWSA